MSDRARASASAFAPDAVASSVDAGTLGAYMSRMRGGFAETGVAAAASGPVHFSPAPGPRHFSPADRTSNPTAGWDPFDPLGGKGADSAADDPIAQARAEGYAAGSEAAQGLASESAETQRAAIEQLAAAIANINGFDRDALAARLRQTVLHLVSRIVGEAGVSQDLLVARIEAAAQLIADSSEPALLRLNPDDLPFVEGRLPDRIFAIADKGIERGGLLIETKSTVVEDGPTAWLAQLTAALDRIALPAAG